MNFDSPYQLPFQRVRSPGQVKSISKRVITPCSIADRSRNAITEKPTPDSLMNTPSEETNINKFSIKSKASKEKYSYRRIIEPTSSESSRCEVMTIRDINTDKSEIFNSQIDTIDTARLTPAHEIRADQDFYMHNMLKAQQKAHLDALLEIKEQVM